MERRALIKQLMLTGMAAAIPFRKVWADMIPALRAFKRPFHRFTVGELELTVITDGFIRLSPVQPNFPNGSEAAEKALLHEHFRPTSEMDLSMNILLIKKGNEVILIDTGTGGAFGEDSGWMLPSMADAGFTPEGVTAVIISHAHPDHVGGLVTKTGQPVFPNAKVYLSKPENAFWMAPQQDFSKSKFQDKQLLAVFTTGTQQTLKALGNRVQLFDDGAELFGCIRMEIAPGHTPGHALTHIYSGNEKIVHVADLVHSDVLSIPHPEWGFNGDVDIAQAAATRKKLLVRFAKEQTKVFAYHFPWPGIGYVKPEGSKWEWVPEAYAVPVAAALPGRR